MLSTFLLKKNFFVSYNHMHMYFIQVENLQIVCLFTPIEKEF